MASPFHDGATAAAALTHRDNFAFLRTLAALMVLVSHQYGLTGRPSGDVAGLHSLAGVGVVFFFAISGFLVAQSWQADPHVGRFALRRLLRVWPGFAVAIIVTAFVIGPIVSKLHWREYLSHPLLREYLHNLCFTLRAGLPLSFDGSALPLAVNGSLWTIPLELQCYLGMALLGLAGVMRRRWLLAALAAALALGYAGWQVRGEWWMAAMRLNVEQLYFIEFGACFLVGAALNAHWPWLAGRKLLLAGAAGALASAAWAAGRPVLAMLVLIQVLAVALGNSRSPVLGRFDRFGDLSYGIYLYAFPVQQTLIWWLDGRLHWWPRLLVTVLVTLACALLSWHLIEKQALRLKPRGPRAATLPRGAAVAGG